MTASSDDAPRVIFTDDGWILSATEPPLTVEVSTFEQARQTG